MTSKARRSVAGPSLAEQVSAQARALVQLWDRAEDWAAPRIPPSQLKVLGVLAGHGPMNLTRLAHELDAIPSSASRLCDRLEAAGLLQRATSAGSRREVSLSVSSEGQRRLDTFAATRRDDFSAVLSKMTPAGQRALLDGLTEFSDTIGELHDRSTRTA